jgi:hypothetical protein
MKGKVVEDFGVAMIEVTFMEKVPLVNKRQLPAPQKTTLKEV